jgi:hypothetical protein
VPNAEVFPDMLVSNAWTGDPDDVRAPPGKDAADWAQGPKLTVGQKLHAEAKPSMRNIKDKRIGWGLIMPHRPQCSAAENAALDGMPQPVRDLVAFRAGAVFGWSEAENGTVSLTRYLSDNTTETVKIEDRERGMGRDALPHYMLILGGPQQIPWEIQYRLNSYAAVGRLDLGEAGLQRYVHALVNDWPGSRIDISKPLLWSVHREYDITEWMAKTITSPLLTRFEDDTQIGKKARFLTKQDATHARLGEALEQDRPGFIVTTSHGNTTLRQDLDAMRRDLGLPVDAASASLPLDNLLKAWQPDGAIWYAHACCSAGSDDGTAFAGLFDPNTKLAQDLEGVGKLGAQSAPLPVALLGAEKPLRAFIGHVEPTFDWSLRSAETGTPLTTSLMESLYCNLFAEEPMTVGGAFDPYFRHIGNLSTDLHLALEAIRKLEKGAKARAARCRITMLDRRSLVIHGDPAVIPPALA